MERRVTILILNEYPLEEENRRKWLSIGREDRIFIPEYLRVAFLENLEMVLKRCNNGVETRNGHMLV